jgi:hypothetical protein
MQIVTSWMEEGIQQGTQEEATSLVLRQLNRCFHGISSQLQERIQNLSTAQLEDLAEALLDFTTVANLEAWLTNR